MIKLNSHAWKFFVRPYEYEMSSFILFLEVAQVVNLKLVFNEPWLARSNFGDISDEDNEEITDVENN